MKHCAAVVVDKRAPIYATDSTSLNRSTLVNFITFARQPALAAVVPEKSININKRTVRRDVARWQLELSAAAVNLLRPPRSVRVWDGDKHTKIL